jgi:2-polyprenyl-3-methyl-5-hydroxy-6-metoxy-1,4-benzoquinol methylase
MVEGFNRQEFWRNPAASSQTHLVSTCRPEFYLDLVNVTKLIVNTMLEHCTRDMSILEIGCGTGRNLVGLRAAGFEHLSGIEISQRAVDVGREAFPDYESIEVTVAAIEDVARQLPKFDVIYTQGCLMHLPWELDWVIEMIKQQARYLIMTNEGEPRHGVHAWARDYQEYIEQGGIWSQVEFEVGNKYPPLPATTIKRVFKRMG